MGSLDQFLEASDTWDHFSKNPFEAIKNLSVCTEFQVFTVFGFVRDGIHSSEYGKFLTETAHDKMRINVYHKLIFLSLILSHYKTQRKHLQLIKTLI